MSVYIYGLKCPLANKIRYVGKSVNPYKRFNDHVRYETKSDTHKARWLRKLIKQGLLPSLVIIEETTTEQWANRERFWISELKKDLTNESEGGKGREKGFKHKPHSIKKIVSALKNRPKELRVSIGIKISKALKGKPLAESTKAKSSVSHKKFWSKLSSEDRLIYSKNLRHDWSDTTKKKLIETTTGAKRTKSTSQYKGVSWFKRDSCWRAWIHDKINRRQIHLGYYENELDAAIAFNSVVVKYHGKLARPNIIPTPPFVQASEAQPPNSLPQ